MLLLSDNGLIFTSKRYLKLMHQYGLEPEFITPYTPEQNGVIERFMRSLKEECIRLQVSSTFREAKTVIESWIHEYNSERPHQELGYVPSIEHRQRPAA